MRTGTCTALSLSAFDFELKCMSVGDTLGCLHRALAFAFYPIPLVLNPRRAQPLALNPSTLNRYKRMTNEERRMAAEDLAKTWCSRPNTVRGTRRLEVSSGGGSAQDHPGRGGEDGEPMGSWGDVREVTRTRKGAAAPCTPWTPLVGRQWVMPADLVDFEHYASAPPGEKSIEHPQPSALSPQPSALSPKISTTKTLNTKPSNLEPNAYTRLVRHWPCLPLLSFLPFSFLPFLSCCYTIRPVPKYQGFN